MILSTLVKQAYECAKYQEELDYISGWPKQYADRFSIDTETVGLNPRQDRVVGVSYSDTAGTAYVAQAQILPPPVGELEAHNWQFDGPAVRQLGPGWENLTCSFDSMVAAYVLNKERQGLKWLSKHELGIEMQSIDDLIISGQFTMADVPWDLTVPYAGADADITHQLCAKFDRQIDEQGLREVFDLEMAILPMLIHMTDNGVLINSPYLKSLETDIEAEMLGVLAEIQEVTGRPEFNPDSPSQLSHLLFTELEIEPLRSTDTPGQFSTDKAILEELKYEHPVIEMVLHYRQLRTLLKTFVAKMPGLLWEDGRLHTTWKQTRVVTGRLSSADPNLQNIPIRGKIGDKVRAAFIARPGYVYVGSDFSNIEPRILAHLCEDERLCELLTTGGDPHKLTASQAFGLDLDAVTDALRDVGKVAFLAISYRAGKNKIGQLFRPVISSSDAAELVIKRGRAPGEDPHTALAWIVIDTIDKLYPRMREWQEEEISVDKARGYSQSLLGRKRVIEHLDASSPKARGQAERFAVNYPMQATAGGDIMKLAMRDVWRTFNDKDWYNPLLQIHDELQDEIREDKAEEYAWAKTEIMEGVMKLRVPLIVKTKIGKSWAETH